MGVFAQGIVAMYYNRTMLLYISVVSMLFGESIKPSSANSLNKLVINPPR